jgi:hypothetical protein
VYALLLALFNAILEDHGLEVIEQSKVLVTANEKIVTLVYALLKREINLIKLIQTTIITSYTTQHTFLNYIRADSNDSTNL